MTLLTADRREEAAIRVCPVHSPDVGQCSDGCLPERLALSRLAASFRNYWYDRARGVRPRANHRSTAQSAADASPPALPLVRMVALEAAAVVLASKAQTTRVSRAEVLRTAITFERWLLEGRW